MIERVSVRKNSEGWHLKRPSEKLRAFSYLFLAAASASLEDVHDAEGWIHGPSPVGANRLHFLS